MKKVVILLILVLLVRLDVLAQVKQWSLRECCDYAISHSISIHQKTNTTRTRALTSQRLATVVCLMRTCRQTSRSTLVVHRLLMVLTQTVIPTILRSP